MSVKIYVPCDAAAVSVGADAVARAVSEQIASRRLDLTVVRNGSRGMFWLEPLVEVETPRGRVAYGPVTAEAVTGLFDAGFVRRQRAPTPAGADRRNSVFEEPGAADLRALRHRRPAFARRLHEPWRLQRAPAGAYDGARKPSSRK